MATRTAIEKLTLSSDLRSWFEQFEIIVGVSGWIVGDTPGQMTKLLICNMEAEMFRKASNLVRPGKIVDTTYESLKKSLCDHFSPKPTKFASRYHFTQTIQEEGEASSSYMERLMTIAMDCEFENLDSRLLDQFVAGLRSETEKAKLLKKTNLTLQTAREHMLSVEKTKLEAQIMKSGLSTSSSTVNNISNNNISNRNRQFKKPKSKALVCRKCTLKGHAEKECYTKCHYCKKVGHIRRNCPNKRKYKNSNFRTHHIEEEDRDNTSELSEKEDIAFVDLDSEFSDIENKISEVDIDFCEMNQMSNFSDNFRIEAINHHASGSTKPLVQVTLNGAKLEMEFDSGSSVSIVSCESLSKLGINVCLSPSQKILRVANNERLVVKARTVVDVQFNGKLLKDLELFVIEGKCPSLMGQTWINEFLGQDWLHRTLRILKDRQRTCNVSCVSCVGKSVDVKSIGSVVSHVPSVQCELPVKARHGDQRPIDRVTVNKHKVGLKENGSIKLRKISELKKSPIFQKGLGLIRGAEAKLALKEGAQPKSLGVRPLPYAKKKQVGDELQRMLNEGIVSKVDEASPWGTPIVPVFKGEKTRICGSYNLTLNPAMASQQYPLPSIEECFNRVAEGKKFTKLDVCQAYNNIPIRKEDRILTTINTHLGQLLWNRLPYGIAPAAAIFQETIDQTLAGIPMCCCRVDDILISGKNDEEHMRVLNEVIHRLEKQGYKCKLEKSEFMKDSVVYLGHTVSKDGISPVKSKVEDMVSMKPPKDVDELVAFLSGVNYYRRYIPNMSKVIAPLEELRKKGVKWKWGKEEQEAWKNLKELLSSKTVLTLYNPNLPLKLDTDASSTGLGAVLSHIMPDGTERPIEYISRTLTAAEKNYSQIDKEATAIVWAVKRFHLYLYGRKFKLITDNQPLVHIFNKNRRLSVMTAARLTRWSIFLMDYDYDICYRSTKAHGNADMLSRLPMPHTKQDEKEAEEDYVQSVDIENTCLTARMIESYTRKDPILAKVLHYVKNGWPDKETDFNEEIIAYWNRRSELSVELGCITWGCRVIIPTKLRSTVLDMLHATHLGMSGMKTLARSYVYWPLINSEIEQHANTCRTCGKYGKSLPSLIEHPWNKPSMPWQRVHIDYAGPFLSKMWLVVYDAYTRWPEVIKMNKDTTSTATIRALREIFSRNGLPHVIVSDNGTNFTSKEFESFLANNNIKHLKTGTYHPKSNGCCERFVGTFKAAMKKMYENCSDVDKNLANFLIHYRITPHSATGISPAEALFKRSLRSRLNQVFPSDQQTTDRIDTAKEQEIIDASSIRNRQFKEQQKVYVQPTNKDTWREGEILKRLGSSNMYEVQFEGRKAVKHADHIKKRLIPVLELKKTPMTAAAENITNNGSTTVRSELSVEQTNNKPKTGIEQTNNKPNTGIEQTNNKPLQVLNKLTINPIQV